MPNPSRPGTQGGSTESVHTTGKAPPGRPSQILRWIKVEDKLANASDIASAAPAHWNARQIANAFRAAALVMASAGSLPPAIARRASAIKPLARARAGLIYDNDENGPKNP